MELFLDQHSATLGVGEFATFSIGPRDSNGGGQGLWRAQLGTHWHQELRDRAAATSAATRFEVSVTGRIFHRGWTLALTGRIDQLIATETSDVLREVKSVLRSLPADESELRREYPHHFVQAATYAALWRAGLLTDADRPAARDSTARPPARAELVFVEADSGVVQTVSLSPADDALFRVQLDRVADFLEARSRSRERLRSLHYGPAFAQPRAGQETVSAAITELFERRPLVFFEAPTGFGKTGVLLEFALGQMRAGHFDRLLYLTGKATGQLQVIRTLEAMTSAGAPTPASALSVWQMRAKSEHCINHTFHCVRESCEYLTDVTARWSRSGLSHQYLEGGQSGDLENLRTAGRAAGLCPYEITRAALAFNDVWIGDYNYVFSPRHRRLFQEQPGYSTPRTLLLVDEAHNLPGRVADACSHTFDSARSLAVRDELHRTRSPSALTRAWDHWCSFLQHQRATPALAPADVDDARDLIVELARRIPGTALDLAALGPLPTEQLWEFPALADELTAPELPRLWWCPREGVLALTCLDAAPVIGDTLRDFGGVILTSATLTPAEEFAAACGLGEKASLSDVDAPPHSGAAPEPNPLSDHLHSARIPSGRLGRLGKRETRRLYRQLTSAAELLRAEEASESAQPVLFRALAPWREGAYEIAVDARVDTSYQHRSHHFDITAAAIPALHRRGAGPVAVFFPSYAYAAAIAEILATTAPEFRVMMQPRMRDLAARTAWVAESLTTGDALLLILGSSFSEGVDLLGGRVNQAMVVGPALPEVNPVQQARLNGRRDLGASRADAFRRVYQLPGMIKVNQALGRLVRAPGQQAKILLHCRRFLEPDYAGLLAPEYQGGVILRSDDDFRRWTGGGQGR